MSQPSTVSETVVQKKVKSGRTRRGGQMREMEKMLAAFFERLYEFIKAEAERLSRQSNLAIEDSQRREAEVKADFEKMRSDLNTLSNGVLEPLVRNCGDEEMLARFRRCGWRV
jgi:hypothetical protein